MHMIKILISRVYSGPEGTFGVIHKTTGEPFALTGELPYNGNRKNISCIPSGVYDCHLYQSPKYSKTYQVMAVPNRTHILFHKGNIPTEHSRGCIIIGEQFEPLNGKMAITHSGKGFQEFMDYLEGDSNFELEIRNHWKF